LFLGQIRNGGPITITTTEMTRFLLSTEEAVDTIVAALQQARPGETYVPRIPSARVADVAAALVGDLPIETIVTGIRPGEKIHEILVSEEEGPRTRECGAYFVIASVLRELRHDREVNGTVAEFSSATDVLSIEEVRGVLSTHDLLPERLSARPSAGQWQP
jgi:UDP-glucose 4-epimerase